MPFVLHPRGVRRLGRLTALLAAAVLGVPAVASAASCPPQPTTTPFTQWGDAGSYFLAPGGNFEAPLWSSGWIAANAGRTLGNEPFHVGGSSDSYSLTIGGGGVAVSPAFCFDESMPYVRFFAHALGTAGNLQVRLAVLTAAGPVSFPFDRVADLPAASMGSWAPTGQLPLTNRAATVDGQGDPARLVFDVAGPGSWQIDDVYVDPYRMG
ncbi:MAG TPA: hypothetical protein VGG41_14370 [Solirubrobacteraceae bacterium]